MTYSTDWTSIDPRPIPEWFDKAKFGIFIHWGVYSVPAWAPRQCEVDSFGQAYAEWYGWFMNQADHPIGRHHQALHDGKPYADFAPQWRAELFDPDAWADLIARSGAKYVALTSKHHDGFCLWPSQHAWNWNSLDIGPHRDLVGDLAQSIRNAGLHMGLYYSLMEWYRPLYLASPGRYAVEHMIPQMKDLIERYHPDLLFTDGEWDHPSELWHSTEFLAWLFNESPVADTIVVNDRWGKETRNVHGGYYTTEYGEVHPGQERSEGRKWEECRGLGSSFGYNRNERIEDYMTERDMVELLVKTVAGGGNLLLNIGPTADGRIPVIMQERLLQMGDWLAQNGRGIFETQPWRVREEPGAAYASSGDCVFAFIMGESQRNCILGAPQPTEGAQPSVRLIGEPRELPARFIEGGLKIELEPLGALNHRGLPIGLQIEHIK